LSAAEGTAKILAFQNVWEPTSWERTVPITVKSFVTPNGNVEPVLADNNFTANFSNTAEFEAAGVATCEIGVYRQYLKGFTR